MRKKLLASCLLLCAVTASAEELIEMESVSPVSAITADDVPFFTMTRRPTLESKLPTNITNLSSEEIRRSGAVNVAEALELVPGLDLTRSGSAGTLTSVRLRGVPDSNQVQVLVDDVPVGGVGIQSINLALIPISNVDRIEVVRGASSVLYGANSIGGVIHVITRKATEAPAASIGFEGGSFRTRVYNADAGGAFGPWRLYVTGQRYRSDGYLSNSDVDSRSGTGSFGYHAGNGVSVRATSSYTDHELGTPNGTDVPFERWNGHEERRGRSATQRIDNEIFRNRVAVDAPVGSAGSLSTSFFHQFETYRFFHKPDDPFIDDSGFDKAIAGADSRFTTPGGFMLGGAYERDEREEVGQLPHHFANWALYAQQDLNMGRFTLLPAFRFDQNSAFGNEYNPRLTAVFRPSVKWKVSASAARSFRAPTLVNLYGVYEDPLFPDFNFYGNPSLKPERSVSYDLGVRGALADWLEAGISGYHSRISDRITAVNLRPDPFDANDTLLNLASAELSGAEVDLKAVTGIFEHRGSLTYQRAVGSTVGSATYEHLRLTPKFMGNYRLTMKPGAGVQFVNTVEYVTRQYNSDAAQGLKLPPYFVWDARLEQKIGPVLWFVGVDNVLRRLYSESVTFGTLTPQPTRTYRGGVRLAFGGESPSN